MAKNNTKLGAAQELLLSYELHELIPADGQDFRSLLSAALTEYAAKVLAEYEATGQSEARKPSDFAEVFPFSSVLCKSEAETIARNIMTILKRTGDKFRELSWGEYKQERLKDGEFTESEQGYFDQVVSYCDSADKAALFPEDWKVINEQ